VDHLGLVKAVDGLSQSVVVELSPTLPTDGSIPPSARRSLYLMDRCCDPRSL
jgi:hypothetical protein